MTKAILFLVSLLSSVQVLADPECLGKNTSATLDKAHSIQRAISCQNDASLSRCNQYLGLGVVGAAAAAGANAASKVRNPDFRICVTPTADFFNFQIFPQAVAGMDCMTKEAFQRTYVKGLVDQSIKDLNEMDARLAARIDSLGGEENLRVAVEKQRELVKKPLEEKGPQHYAEETSIARDNLQAAHESLPEWKEMTDLELERADLHTQLKANANGTRPLSKISREAMEARELELSKRIGELDKQIRSHPKIIEASSKYYEAHDKYIKSQHGTLPKETIGSLDQEQKILKSLLAKQKQVDDAAVARAIIKQQLDKLNDMKRINPMTSASLNNRINELVRMGVTSDAQLSYFKKLGSLEANDGIGLARRMRFFSNPQIVPRVGGLGYFAKGLGAGGLFLGLATAASAEEAQDNTEDFLSASLLMNSPTNCPGEIPHPYLETNRCRIQTNYASKEENFYALSDDEMTKAIVQRPEMCEALDKAYAHFYQAKNTKVTCGTEINIRSEKGAALAIFSEHMNDPQGPQHIKLFQDGQIFDMNVTSEGEIQSLNYTYTTKGNDLLRAKTGRDTRETLTHKIDVTKDSKEMQSARYYLQTRMAGLMDTAACCDKDAISASNEDCSQLGVAKSSGESSFGKPSSTTTK